MLSVVSLTFQCIQWLMLACIFHIMHIPGSNSYKTLEMTRSKRVERERGARRALP